MKIYTITLNPAYDIHANAPVFLACRENFAEISARNAGGKGVNISRALCAMDVPNTAIVVIGKENGSEFKSELEKLRLDVVYLERPGRIRENLTLHHGGEETRISFSGFTVDDDLLAEAAERIIVDGDTYVAFTGSIPAGISKVAVKSFLLSLKKRGVRLVVDCRNFDLDDIGQIGPWLVKPNQQEVSQWFSLPVNNMEQASECAKRLHEMGVENAMVSMGAQGAVLASDRVYMSVSPKVKPVSTIGAGDSSIAGFLCAATQWLDRGECLRYAVAFGTAACLTEGTLPPDRDVISQLLTSMQ